MKKTGLFLLTVFLTVMSGSVMAQCSLCTKTAQQLGEGPAKGLNNGILMLALTPLAIIGFLAFRWWRSNKEA
ncbi:hypothetical protein SAMN05660461_4474 [Chitinophaga ginsengisegetis]|jgi:hypothetical protein|uniref:Uncharacterized protein n=1 Tax=Chitinophaga ginsengisegetis TaxID=393003 RepID=A0A1T5P7C7_9BACT|nr:MULTISPECIES: hypothetical protein [Chitinophaga]MDR6565964.1 hypothetical protein [Chitinophaga ginsengisegetis]MDR6645693.1 hypothetical protein [Chitinophaga ginsengisegetis]MDR6651715.1 hypothetical protein [Chitinophaga ginsengisegetis]SKD08602.1 hypothetical protein SAMN05660461_4474 [Chitinophaga ginsengisegetis]HWV68598.1 hypothetical protein [Chitinophaga sp.]